MQSRPQQRYRRTGRQTDVHVQRICDDKPRSAWLASHGAAWCFQN